MIKLNLPSSWKDVTIQKFIECNEILQDNELNQLEKSVKLLACLSEESEEIFDQLMIEEFKILTDKISFLEDLNIKDDLKQVIKVGNRWFFVNLDINKLSFGQYVDLMEFSKEKDKVFENIHKVLGVLLQEIEVGIFRNKIKPYDGKRHEEVSRFLFNSMTMDQAYPIATFFLRLWESSIEVIQAYLESQKMILMNIQEKEMSSPVGMDG